MSSKKIDLVVAYNENWAIGNNNKMLWHIPEESKLFKTLTTNRACIMGRKTWESLPDKFRPLPNRTNVIVSTKKSIEITADGRGAVQLSSSLEKAIEFASNYFFLPILIGGGELYKEAIEKDLVSKVMASEIKGYTDVSAQTYFPNLKELGWSRNLIKSYQEFDFVIWENST